MEIFTPQIAHRDQAIGPCFIQTHEDAELGDAADLAAEFRAQTIRQESRQIAVCRVAFRDHRAAFGLGNMRAGVFQPFDFFGRQTVIAPLVGRDQRAVHDQVGIAPDGRCKVRIVL